jgi:hypothetical protein
MNKRNLSKIFGMLLFLFFINGCNRFHKIRLLESVGYDADECAVRDRTHHRAPYENGTNSDRTNIKAREYRCRIERICVGKSEEENAKCKKDAGNYWSFTEDNHFYQVVKHDDDESDAICALKPSSCSPKWHSQENYATNPYWNKETKSYILPKNPNK